MLTHWALTHLCIEGTQVLGWMRSTVSHRGGRGLRVRAGDLAAFGVAAELALGVGGSRGWILFLNRGSAFLWCSLSFCSISQSLVYAWLCKLSGVASLWKLC